MIEEQKTTDGIGAENRLRSVRPGRNRIFIVPEKSTKELAIVTMPPVFPPGAGGTPPVVFGDSIELLVTLERAPTTGPEALTRLCEDVAAIQRELQKRIQDVLSTLGGQEFPSIEAKQDVVARINRLLAAAEARIECPSCGEPGTFRCAATGNAKDGAFQFEHNRPKTVHGAKIRFPEGLRLA